jgi:hypothetical protein
MMEERVEEEECAKAVSECVDDRLGALDLRPIFVRDKDSR